MSPVFARRQFLFAAAAGTAMPHLSRPALASDPIRIGTLAPMTGGGAPFGPEIADAHRRVVNLVNSSGGIGGRQIQLIQENSETNPESAIRAARKLVDVDRVMAIIGTWSSSVTLGIMPLCQEANVIQMCTSAAVEIPKRDKKGLVFNFQPLSPAWGKAIGSLAMRRNLKTYAVMALNNDFTLSMVEAFAAEVKAGGGKMLGEPIVYNDGQGSYRAEVAKAIGHKPDAIFIPGYVTDFTAVYRELYRAGYKGVVVTISAATGAAFKQAVGPAANGILHGFPVPPVGGDTYNAYLRFVGVEPNGQVQNSIGCAAYDQINVLLLAIASAGGVDPNVVKEHIRRVANGPGTKVTTVPQGLAALKAGQAIDYVGASSDVQFKPDSGTLVSRDFMLYEIKDGKDSVIERVVSYS
jgi:branched-chain amino acid transport system substrate-binding protein